MDKPPHLNWAGRPEARLARGLIAAAATLPILALLSFSPMSWWKQSGFTSYPGTFVRVAGDDYRLCRPWSRQFPQTRQDPSLKVTARFGTVLGRQESNFAVLLPKAAQVTAIYCGAAPVSSPLSECSGAHCAEPLKAQVEDGVYTLGRGVIFSIRTKAASPGQRTNVGFWVMWRPPKAAN
jgi:hypothetical protein